MKIYKTKRNEEIIAKDSKLGREMSRRNDSYKKLIKDAQKDEYKAVNNYNEGYCYGCNSIDGVAQNLFYICTECYQKRGDKGLLANITLKEIEELCDLCGYWKFGVWQRNVALCRKCMNRVSKIHAKYRNKGEGIMENNVFHSRLRRIFGKDWKKLSGVDF